MMMRMKARGFTLVEILVAIAILTVITVMAYAGYNELAHQSELATERMDRVRAVQTTVLKLSQDFEQLEPRPVREPLGVAGLITPWNFPIAIPAWKLAPNPARHWRPTRARRRKNNVSWPLLAYIFLRARLAWASPLSTV